MKASAAPPPPPPPSSTSAAPPSRNLSTYDPSSSDGFIRFIAGLLRHSFVLADSFAESVTGTMSMVETLVAEHLSKSEGSRLQRLVPSIGRMHTPLALVEAFGVYDAKYALTRRTHVPPSEDEVRHILNLAQIFSSAAGLQFISFDGDETLYADGKNFAQSDAQKLARYIEKLLSSGIGVALVTAAGYKGAPEKYETRLDGLLHYLAVHKVTDTALERFFVVGGECNYLFEAVRVSAEVAAACKCSPRRLSLPTGTRERRGGGRRRTRRGAAARGGRRLE
jgi:IMP and pyridine-specific 5'-nucleotidase